MGLINTINEAGIPLMNQLSGIFHESNGFPELYTTVARWIFVVLALFVFIKSIRALWAARGASEIWAYLILPDGSHTPLTHWENVIGRSKNADVVVDVMTVSRSHGLLVRDEHGSWRYDDLGSSGGSQINGGTVYRSTPIEAGDTISLAGAECQFIPASLAERLDNLDERRKISFGSSPLASLLALSLFQVLLCIQLIVAKGTDLPFSVILGILGLLAIMWGYWSVLRIIGLRHFEIETIAFFLCSLNLAVTASSSPDEVIKQLISIFLGVCLFFGLCLYLRELNRTLWVRRLLVIISVLLLLLNLVFGTLSYGSTNWVSLGGLTFQPSEFVKIAFIFIGSATLEELYQKKNLGLFMVFSLFCLGCLAVMGDFGTAAIFFVTYLVISFLRSGEFSKLFLTVGGALGAGLMILRFKPYIATRFDTWGNAWQFADAGGFQQTRTMTAGASGGLLGVGAGEGWLHNVFAADTDLVFGMLSEEWGLIIAVLAVLCIFALGVFAYRSILAGRSSFYTIAACSATSLFVFQTMLNVFGSVDLFPLTGVTFPFVSNGGSSMVAAWGLLAFLKAADTRQDASLAVKVLDEGTQEGDTQ